jgi:hypothetical protein
VRLQSITNLVDAGLSVPFWKSVRKKLKSIVLPRFWCILAINDALIGISATRERSRVRSLLIANPAMIDHELNLKLSLEHTQH